VEQDAREGLPLDVLWPDDVSREGDEVENPREVEPQGDAPAGGARQVEPERIGRPAVEVNARL